MKILFYNLGYESGLNGSKKEYIFGFYRFFFFKSRKAARIAEKFMSEVIEIYHPDMLAFVEISSRGYLAQKLSAYYPFASIHSKYAPNHHARFFFADHRSNALFSQKNYEIGTRYFSYGNKRLVYEVALSQNEHIFIAHFSLRASIRKKQFGELGTWIQKTEKVVIIGDFNIFGGIQELQELCETYELSIYPSLPTFPSHKPTKFLDICLVSKNYSCEAKVLSHIQFSDHLPLLLTIS